MYTMIISDGIEQVKQLQKFLGEKELPNRGDIMHYHFFDNDGNYLTWDHAGDLGHPFSKILQLPKNEYGQYEVVLTTNVLNGKVKLPWVYVEDEQHPPKGYRLVTDKEKKNMVKPDYAKYWDGMRKWSHVFAQSGWNQDKTYCIPVECKLEPKTVKMTVAEINKALGKNIEVIEG